MKPEDRSDEDRPVPRRLSVIAADVPDDEDDQGVMPREDKLTLLCLVVGAILVAIWLWWL